MRRNNPTVPAVPRMSTAVGREVIAQVEDPGWIALNAAPDKTNLLTMYDSVDSGDRKPDTLTRTDVKGAAQDSGGTTIKHKK